LRSAASADITVKMVVPTLGRRDGGGVIGREDEAGWTEGWLDMGGGVGQERRSGIGEANKARGNAAF